MDSKGEVVDLFSGETEVKYQRENIEDVIRQLSKQFPDPTDCVREFIQNSLDAESPQIHVTFEAEKVGRGQVIQQMVVEDFGVGMTKEERDNYFLTIFRSSKEDDPNKIGKYGIGILSPLLLEPDEFIAESTGTVSKTKAKESWKLHMKNLNTRPQYSIGDIEERQGTKITLRKKMQAKEAEKLIDTASEKISFFCERSRIPIYVDGRFINKEFRLDTPIQTHRTSPGLEYVVGVEDEPSYELHNNRLKLEEGGSFVDDWKELSFIISSTRFHHTFSRDSVVRDKDFYNVRNELFRGIGHLFLQSLEILEDFAQNPVEERYGEKPPGIKLEYSYGLRTINSRPQYEIVREDLERDHKNHSLKENLDDAKEKLDKFIQVFEVFEKEKEEHDKKVSARIGDERKAFEFITDYILRIKSKAEDTVHGKNLKVRYKIKGTVEKKVRKQSEDAQLYAAIKRNLPSGFEKYKWIQTIDGELLGLDTLLDIYQRDGKVYFLERRNHVLEELAQNNGKKVFPRYTIGISFRFSKKIIHQSDLLNRLGPFENIDTDYYPRCEITDTTRISKREADFLAGVCSYLSKKRGSVFNEIYFTGYEEVAESDKHRPIVAISTTGKKKITQRGMNRLLAPRHFGIKYDLAINLDHYAIQQLLTLHYRGDDKKFTYKAFDSLLPVKWI